MSPDPAFQAFYDQAMNWVTALHQLLAGLPLPYAFVAGMLATLNPCGFVMLPGYAAFYSTVDDAPAGHSRQAARAAWMGILVTIAFVGVFSLSGLVITAGGRALMHWAGWAGVVVGVLLAGLCAAQLVAREQHGRARPDAGSEYRRRAPGSRYDAPGSGTSPGTGRHRRMQPALHARRPGKPRAAPPLREPPACRGLPLRRVP